MKRREIVTKTWDAVVHNKLSFSCFLQAMGVIDHCRLPVKVELIETALQLASQVTDGATFEPRHPRLMMRVLFRIGFRVLDPLRIVGEDRDLKLLVLCALLIKARLPGIKEAAAALRVGAPIPPLLARGWQILRTFPAFKWIWGSYETAFFRYHLDLCPPLKAPKYTWTGFDYYLADFVRGEKIGKGSYGTIYRWEDKVLKVEFHDIINESALRELNFLLTFSHPHLVEVERFYYGDLQTTLVMEAYQGSLSEVAVPPSELGRVLEGMWSGLAYLHSEGMLHGDISLSNILIKEGKVVIADLGLATLYEGKKRGGLCGSLYYRAPEVLQPGKKYGLGADVWAGGCVSYYLLFGKFPFLGKDDIEMLMAIYKCLGMSATWKKWVSEVTWSEEIFFQDYFTSIFTPPKMRISASELSRRGWSFIPPFILAQ